MTYEGHYPICLLPSMLFPLSIKAHFQRHNAAESAENGQVILTKTVFKMDDYLKILNSISRLTAAGERALVEKVVSFSLPKNHVYLVSNT